MSCAKCLAKFLLKSIYVGARRGDPVGGEGFGDIRLLAAGHMGWGEIDTF
jgi:hypothetical protein